MRFCECGCGGEVKEGRRFVLGHSRIGKHHTKKSKRRMSEASKGRHHTEETRRKMSESHRGENNPRFGKHHTKETRKKMSEAHKGQIPWMKGKHPTEEVRRKMSEAHMGEKNHWYGKHRTAETRRKISESNKEKCISEETREKLRKATTNARKRGCFNIKPTTPEKKFMRICAKHSLPYKYVGDGKFSVESVNPDFVESNGGKIAVEIYGDYWHKLPKVMERDKRRKAILSKYGWKLLVLWEHEINELPESEIVRRVSFGQRW